MSTSACAPLRQPFLSATSLPFGFVIAFLQYGVVPVASRRSCHGGDTADFALQHVVNVELN